MYLKALLSIAERITKSSGHSQRCGVGKAFTPQRHREFGSCLGIGATSQSGQSQTKSRRVLRVWIVNSEDRQWTRGTAGPFVR